MRTREKILLVTILAQILVCILTPMQVYPSIIIFRGFITLFIGLVFWFKLVSAIQYESFLQIYFSSMYLWLSSLT